MENQENITVTMLFALLTWPESERRNTLSTWDRQKGRKGIKKEGRKKGGEKGLRSKRSSRLTDDPQRPSGLLS